MLKYIYIGNFRVPTYSLFVILGVVLCNCIAQLPIKRNGIDKKYFFLIELFGGIGSIVGAKTLAIYEYSSGTISLSVIKEAGYSYYGGLLGFFLLSYIICKVCKIECGYVIASKCMFLMPLLHSFWKIACFMGGCCYGIQYNGIFAVVYPDGINELSGHSVFPTPIIEAICSLLISQILYIFSKKKDKYEAVGTYCMLYGVSRFFIEFLRYHDKALIISNAQINSIICAFIGFFLISLKVRSKGKQ